MSEALTSASVAVERDQLRTTIHALLTRSTIDADNAVLTGKVEYKKAIAALLTLLAYVYSVGVDVL